MVATTTFNEREHRALVSRRTVDASGLRSNVGHFGLGSVGFLLIGISVWGAIVPFLGPTFGYSADGAGSWHWSLTHAVVAVAPGAVGVLIGLMVLARSRGMVVGRGRLSLAGSGLLALAAGAWFAVAPWAWPVVENTRAYFVGTSPLRLLANVGGYALGPGLIVAACGAFFLGWATRHQDTGGSVVTEERFAPVAPATGEGYVPAGQQAYAPATQASVPATQGVPATREAYVPATQESTAPAPQGVSAPPPPAD
jgi:hypothetical protein